MWFRVSIAAVLLMICAMCAASVAGYDIASVMKGILSVESGGHQYSINDNATRRSYQFNTKAEAVKMAKYLLSLDHNIDMGQYQINSIQLARGWNVEDLFETAFSRNAAETVFSEWMSAAKKRYGETVLAWQRAIGAYNSGGVGLRNGNPTYTGKVMRAMGLNEAPLDKGDANSQAAGQKLALSALRTGDEEEDEDAGDADLDLAKNRVGNSDSDKVFIGILMVVLLVLVVVFGVPAMKVLFAVIRVSMGMGKRLSKMTRGGK